MPRAFTPVFLTREIREIEAIVLAQPGAPSLMARAGTAVARLAREMLGERGKRILVLAGGGNNGGDAFVAASQLKQAWFEPTVVFTGQESKLPPDAKAAWGEWRAAGGRTTGSVPPDAAPDLIIDGLFGIGLERPLQGQAADIVSWVNGRDAGVLSIDVPSGLHADSGRVLGCAVRARRTLTFIGLKAGLFTLDGPDYAGEVIFDPLGVDIPDAVQPHGWRIESPLLASVLPLRKRNSHKGTFGNVGVVGGAPGMVGAALLAGRAALKLGAGRVFAGLFSEELAVDLVQPELMIRPAQEVLKIEDLDCIAAGPGLGQSQAAQHALAAAIAHKAPLVLDADALNLLAAQPKLHKALLARASETILTPHPAEAARLLATGTDKVQSDRIGAARALGTKFNAAVVLKGNGSICALRSGDWYVNTSGNPGMAAAGMGDALTGMVASLAAQGGDPDLALLAGVHLHGLAADRLVASGIGPAGLTASEVIDAARRILNEATA
ncbi:MAG TPA: NAD(P)H-hydrate dehydratase [Burkholderiales bacterium]|nr:NAD(P)H-hydrate dehydratase [Burkholderiales bacterium]